MEDGSSQRSVGLPNRENIKEVFASSCTPASYHWNISVLSYGTGQLQVVPLLGSIPVYRCNEDFTST